MKTLLTILLVTFGLHAYSQPIVKYKPSTRCFTINDSRSAVYKFQWTDGVTTYEEVTALGMHSFSTPSIICAAEENDNDPAIYLFGGIKDGWVINVYKDNVLLKSVTVNFN